VKRPARSIVLVSLALTSVHAIGRLPLITTRRFDPDEFEHAHVAWSLLQGLVPYRDFFEHHTPVYHYVLAALLSSFDVSGSADAGFHALFAARYLSWAMSLAVLAMTFLLARRLLEPSTGWVALALASASLVLSLRAIEIRPDVLASVFWLGSIASLYEGFVTRRLKWFVLGGALIGTAVLTSQKLLMAGPPLAVLLIWYAASSRFGGRARERLIAVLGFATGVTTTWMLAVAFFAVQGTAGVFLRLTVLESLRWRPETSVATLLSFLTRFDPWFFALAAGGIVVLLGEAIRSPASRPANIVLVVPAAGLFAGLFVLPVPYPQYFLTFMPLLAIIGASFLVRAVRLAPEDIRQQHPVFSFDIRVGIATCVMVAAVGLAIAKPVVFSPVVYPLLIAAAVTIVLTIRFHGYREMALAAVLVVLAAIPLQGARWMRSLGDQGQFAQLRYVLDRPPDAVVLDGWSGYGVFRPHAFYHWMLHPGVRAMLPPATVHQMVGELASGRVVPAVVVMDEHLRAFSDELARLVERRYAAAGQGDIFIRPDEGTIR
jgi:hypothetical protein